VASRLACHAGGPGCVALEASRYQNWVAWSPLYTFISIVVSLLSLLLSGVVLCGVVKCDKVIADSKAKVSLLRMQVCDAL
jgi:hypothetical protein